MWGLSRRPRTQGNQGSLGLLQSQAERSKWINLGAEERIPLSGTRLPLAFKSLRDWRLEEPFLNWKGALWIQAA